MITYALVVLACANLFLGSLALSALARLIRLQHQPSSARPSHEIISELPRIDVDEIHARHGALVHYVVQRHDGRSTLVEYEGNNSDAAVAAWVRLESEPASYPGTHEFLENGRRRGHRLEEG